jgi:hypothetical protein
MMPMKSCETASGVMPKLLMVGDRDRAIPENDGRWTWYQLDGRLMGQPPQAGMSGFDEVVDIKSDVSAVHCWQSSNFHAD